MRLSDLIEPRPVRPDAPLSLHEWIFGALVILSPIITLVALAALCGGCFYKGAKVTEGTDLAIGLNVPVSEGTLQFQVLNYLSGFRLGVDRNAILKCSYTVAESNSYLGVVHTQVAKTMNATVEPCETNAEAVSSPTNQTTVGVSATDSGAE